MNQSTFDCISIAIVLALGISRINWNVFNIKYECSFADGFPWGRGAQNISRPGFRAFVTYIVIRSHNTKDMVLKV